MQILHPKEIAVCHKYYSPSEEEANEAYEIVRLYNEASKNSNGVSIMNGKFISPPTYKRALQLIDKYEIIKRFEAL
jgi:citrate lyase subunit beta / citryl-CoA lyase